MGSTQLVRVGGRRIPVSRTGAGPAVLILNGMGGSPVTWRPLVRYLQGYECVAVALPGCPRVTSWKPVLTMHRFASLASDLLDALGIGRADVLGFSFGGMVAQQLALDAPEQIRRLGLISTSCGLGAVPSNPLAWWSAVLADVSPPSFDPLWLARQWHRTMRSQFGAGAANRLWLNESAQQIAAASRWSSLSWLHRLPQKTLTIAGTADALVPSINTTILASRIPDARTFLVRGGGHFCVLDRVAETGPVIADFLDASELTALDHPA
jgi:pimeloyl-ACP methyl ester carboxylesterase